MGSSIILYAILVAVVLTRFATSELCDGRTVALALYSGLNKYNAGLNASIGALQGEAVLDRTGFYLTSTSPVDASARKGYGGFFLKEPINFQGDGGFSVLFGIQASDGLDGGSAWDFVLTDATERGIRPPPYGPGSSSFGHGGWSRQKAMVVEFLSQVNAPGSPTPYGTKISIYLDGTEVCGTEATDISTANGTAHYVWVDFFGLFSKLDVRISTSPVRPDIPTTQCIVPIWSVLDITLDNHLGLEAYNPNDKNGAAHALVNVLSYYDAYRYSDYDGNEQCAVYGRCSRTSTSSLCTEVNDVMETGTTDIPCIILSCPPSFYRNEAGLECCAFAEGGSWVPNNRKVPAGGETTCDSVRATKVFQANSTDCV
jgi:hypothetical protein